MWGRGRGQHPISALGWGEKRHPAELTLEDFVEVIRKEMIHNAEK